MALDWPCDEGRVQIADVAVRAATVSANIMDYLVFMFTENRTLCFRHFRLDETAEKDVPDRRGRMKTADLKQTAPYESKLGEGG